MNAKDEIKDRLSILDVVSSYIRVEKSGNSYRAKCPFHNEKSPSFYLSNERKSYHCFGCQAHGDIFSFVEKIEHLPFYDAYKLLAEKAGVDIRNRDGGDAHKRILDIHKVATQFYINNLSNSAEAMLYIKERGLNDNTISDFQIGYAPNDWRQLYMHLKNNNFTDDEIEDSGVCIKSEKGLYDRWRGRIMFPIRNISGAVVAFTGRILPTYQIQNEKEVAKYVNSPETNIYHKSKILFGYDKAKNYLNESKTAILVEGQMDMIMSYQAGVRNVIAVSGTAFTDEQVKMLKRFVDTVIFAFDNDKAGQAARDRSIKMCMLNDIEVKCITKSDSKDAADLVKLDPNLWIDQVKNNKSIIEILLDELAIRSDDIRERNAILRREILPLLNYIKSPIDRDYFISLITRMTNIDKEALKEELSKTRTETNETDNKISKTDYVKPDLYIELIALSNMLNIELILPDYVVIDNSIPDEIIKSKMFEIEKKYNSYDYNKIFEAIKRDYLINYLQNKIKELNEKLKIVHDEEAVKILEEINSLNIHLQKLRK